MRLARKEHIPDASLRQSIVHECRDEFRLACSRRPLKQPQRTPRPQLRECVCLGGVKAVSVLHEIDIYLGYHLYTISRYTRIEIVDEVGNYSLSQIGRASCRERV